MQYGLDNTDWDYNYEDEGPLGEMAKMTDDKKYYLSVSKQLFGALHMAEIDPNDVLGFLSEQVVAMQNSPSNFPKGRSRIKSCALKRTWDPAITKPQHRFTKDDLETQNNNMWIMRGFYPNTNIMFKVSLINLQLEDQVSWFAKATFVVPKVYKNTCTSFSSDQLNAWQLQRTLENSVFGHTTMAPLLTLKDIKAPRCMAPKGLSLIKQVKT